MRKKIASWFGRREHWAGEALGVWLWGIIFLTEAEWYQLIAAILWTTYFLSHRLEKKFYGRNGFR